MKHLLLILLLFLFFGKTGFGQHKAAVDSLLQELSVAKADATKVDIYLSLYYALHRTDLTKAVQYAEKAKQLSEKINFIEGLAKAYYRLGIGYVDLGDFVKAEKELYLSIRYAKTLKDSTQLGSSYSGLAGLYLEKADYDSAASYYLTALKLLEKQQDSNSVARIHNQLGNLYHRQRQYHKALSHYQKALALVRELRFLPGISACLNNIGGIYKEFHQYDMALTYLEEALEIKVRTGDKLGEARVLHELGNISRIQKNYDQAKSYFEKVLALGRETDNPKQVFMTLYSLGYNELKRKNYARAIHYARQAMHQDHKDLRTMIENQELLAQAYAAQKDHSKAYEHLALSKTYSDSLYNEQMLKTTNALEARYQNEKKEKKIATLNAAREINTLQLQKRKTERNYLIAFALLVIILIAVVWSRYRIKTRANKKLKELDRLKSRFFANISHEFRTPLTLILGPLQELQKDDFEGDRAAWYRVMRHNAQSLLHMVSQLLDLSKIEARQMKLRAAETDLIPFLKQIAAAYESLAVNKDITFKLKTEEKTLRLPSPRLRQVGLYADREKLEKILNNLLSNAFKFTEAGGKIILSAGIGTLNGKPCARICISDTGPGIAADKLDHIFDRFYQGGDSHTPKGTGIGLALTRELVALHHGAIKVESTPGKGATFILLLPLGKGHLTQDEIISAPETVAELIESPDEIVPSQPPEQRPEPAENTEGLPSILVVDDNAEMRKFLCHILWPHYSVTQASNGMEGLEKAGDLQPDLVLSDVMMPAMDDVELCRRLKLDENTSHIPVVLLTARSGKTPKIEGLESGADDYLNKPFDRDELLALLKNRIAQRALLRERFSKEITVRPRDIAITGTDEKFLQEAMDVVEKNMDDFDFNVQGLIAHLHLGRTQTERKLKALTGQTPVEFIRLMRLKRAAQKITAKEDTITRIAYSVGFNNLSYFAKCFKEHFGQAPSTYGGQ